MPWVMGRDRFQDLQKHVFLISFYFSFSYQKDVTPSHPITVLLVAGVSKVFFVFVLFFVVVVNQIICFSF